MATTTETDADRKELLQALFEHREVDPEVAKRVMERSERLQAQYHRALDAAELIRSVRDE